MDEGAWRATVHGRGIGGGCGGRVRGAGRKESDMTEWLAHFGQKGNDT